MSLKGSVRHSGAFSEAAPLKKYHLESRGEKAAASMGVGRSDQRWRRDKEPLTLPSVDTVQYTLPLNTSTVSFWSGNRIEEITKVNVCVQYQRK